jgi:hypothetical protein
MCEVDFSAIAIYKSPRAEQASHCKLFDIFGLAGPHGDWNELFQGDARSFCDPVTTSGYDFPRHGMQVISRAPVTAPHILGGRSR